MSDVTSGGYGRGRAPSERAPKPKRPSHDKQAVDAAVNAAVEQIHRYTRARTTVAKPSGSRAPRKPAIHDLVTRPPKRRPATPIVTEHTRGQAHGGAAYYGTELARRGMPANYGTRPYHGFSPSDYQELSAISPHSIPLLQQAAANLIQDAYYAPGGLYQTAKAPVLDVAHGDPTFSRSREVAKQIALGTYGTGRHPLRRPGDSALLAFAVASAGAGAAAKAGTVGRELAAGNIAGAAKTAVTRSVPGEIDLPGGVQALEYDNPLLRGVQHARLRRVSKKVQAGTGGQHVVGREIRAREQVLADVAQAPIHALEKMLKRLSPQEHAAMRIAAVEGKHALRSPRDVVARHIATHERYAQEAEAKAQKLRQAATPNEAAIRRAEQEVILNQEVVKDLRHPGVLAALENPSPAFLKATAQARRVSRQSQAELYAHTKFDAAGGQEALRKIAAEYGNPAASLGAETTPLKGARVAGTRSKIEGSRWGSSHQDLIDEKGRVIGPDEDLVLYHATSPAVARQILQHGFRPGRKKHTPPPIITDPTLAKMLRKNVGDRMDYSIGHGQGEGVYLGPNPKHLQQVYGDVVLEVRIPRKHLMAAPEKKGRLSPEKALLIDDGYTTQPIPAKDVRLYDAGEHSLASAPRGSFYFPTGERFKHPSGPTKGAKAVGRRFSPHGVPPVTPSRYLGGTLRERTLKGLRRGVVQRPGTAIATRAAGTAKLAGAERVQQTLVRLGTKDKISDDQILIRTGPISDNIRREVAAALEEAQTGDETALVRAQERIRSALRPAAGEDGVWVHKGFIKEIPAASGSRVARVAATFNKPFRFTGVYAQPKYVLINRPQNFLMRKMMQIGLPHTELKGRVKSMRQQLGDNVSAVIDGMAGETRTHAYMPQSRTGAAERAVTEKIMEVTDVDERFLAVLARAAQKGYRSEQDLRRLATSTDAKVVNDRVAISRRARKDMVDFAMTPFERELSDMIYFYPWLRSGSVWAGRWLLNRPGQAEFAAQVAQQGREAQHNQLGPVPRWMQPYVGVPGGLSNTAPLFTPITPAEIADTLAHPGPGEGHSFAQDFGTPFAQLIGTPRSQLVKGFTSELGPTSILQAAGVMGKPTKTFPQRGPLQAAERSFFGTVAPRKPNMEQVGQSAEREMAPAPKTVHKYTTKAEYLNIKVTPALKRAIDIAGQRAAAQAKYPKTTHGRFQGDLDVAVKLGLLTPVQRSQILANVRKMGDHKLSAELAKDGYSTQIGSKNKFFDSDGVLGEIDRGAREKKNKENGG